MPVPEELEPPVPELAGLVPVVNGAVIVVPNAEVELERELVEAVPDDEREDEVEDADAAVDDEDDDPDAVPAPMEKSWDDAMILVILPMSTAMTV